MTSTADYNELVNSFQDIETKVSTFRGVIYGSKGVGKTTLGMQILQRLVPPDKMILDIDTSEGYVSLRNVPGLMNRVKVQEFKSYESVRLLASYIRDKVAPFDKVGGVMLDEMSKMAEQDAVRVFEARQRGDYGAKEQATALDQATTEGRDHQIALNRFRKMYYDLFDNRDIHVIATAHMQEKKDKQGVIIGIAPDFSPKIGGQVGQLTHLVGYLTAKNEPNPADLKTARYTRDMQVHPTIRVDAKTRLDIKSTSVKADTLPDIIAKWAEHGVEVDNTEIRADEDNFILTYEEK